MISIELKKRKISNLKLLVSRSSIILLLLSFYLLVQYNRPAPQVISASTEKIISQNPSLTPSPLPTQPVYGLPVRLEIPKLNINATVKEEGVNAKGNLDVPATLQDVGWYKYGPNPGQEGSAVIDGHLGVGERGVFADLSKLQAGDKVFVVDKNGQKTSFIVRKTQIYDRLAHPEEVFISSSGAHLNLITCSGDWINSIHGTPNRLVVFTDLLK